MNNKTGEILSDDLIKKIPKKQRKLFAQIDTKNLTQRMKKLLEQAGKTVITRNSRCPCGSGKRFKRCCMMILSLERDRKKKEKKENE